MKKLLLSLLVMSAVSVTVASGQSIVGKWLMVAEAPDGTEVSNLVTFAKDGAMTVDFANDGTVDVNATYTMEGDEVSIEDTTEESPCYGETGIYEVDISGGEMTATVVDDPCDERRGDGEPMTMTKVK